MLADAEGKRSMRSRTGFPELRPHMVNCIRNRLEALIVELQEERVRTSDGTDDRVRGPTPSSCVVGPCHSRKDD